MSQDPEARCYIDPAALVERWVEEQVARQLAERERDEAVARASRAEESFSRFLQNPDELLVYGAKLGDLKEWQRVIQDARKLGLTQPGNYFIRYVKLHAAVQEYLGGGGRTDLRKALDDVGTE